ncbi:DsrE family protein [Bradyrhizobium sp. CCGUVB14]|uniref:DsrE family protein n=1 Tax=Bradyrhizobium sp. CCGUVB14 TaxID=2949628 RepID=UPI0020B29294|nr:DsrE family protein [Bradyrhizobium sp. CCGUVB14]MCP3446568.1 DsrE family protein [Bradyrhizobium sp. CCGUVB14]
MNRRNILWSTVSALGAAFAASRAKADDKADDNAAEKAATEPARSDKLKVVYHLADADKVNFVLGNIQNHIDGVGGPDHVTLALVIHGPALKAFHWAQANPDVSRRVGNFAKDGVELAACGNTMKAQNITLTDLLPGFVSAEKGGVVRLAELQSQGYLYLRP